QSHLPYARALAMSVRQSNPDIAVYVLLVDGDGKQPDGNEPFNTITLAQLPDQAIIGRMAFYYTPFEFCNALKAHLSTYVMSKLKPGQWLCLDSDMRICASLEPIWRQLESASILLTPHCTRPTPDPGASKREAAVIKYGVFNGGLMGLSKCQETSEFLRWFA